MKNTRTIAPLVTAVVLAGCASTPPVELKYYPSTWSITVEVTRSMVCSDDRQRFFYADTPIVVPSYRAHSAAGPWTVRLRDLDGAGAAVTFAAKLTPDGRLASINGSAEGSGGAVVQALTGLVSTVAALGGPPPADSPVTAPLKAEPGAKDANPKPPADPCKVVTSFADGPTTLVFRTTFGPELKAADAPLTMTADRARLQELLHRFAPAPLVTLAGRRDLTSGPRPDAGQSQQQQSLLLQEAEVIDIRVCTPSETDTKAGGSKAACEPTDGRKPTLDTRFAVLVPKVVRIENCDPSKAVCERPVGYHLPLPTAALFGKSGFKVQLHESGTVAEVEYGRTSGASDVLGALNSAIAPGSAAARAERKKAEADLVAQQQRLILCRAEPAKCAP